MKKLHLIILITYLLYLTYLIYLLYIVILIKLKKNIHTHDQLKTAHASRFARASLLRLYLILRQW